MIQDSPEEEHGDAMVLIQSLAVGDKNEGDAEELIF